MTQVRRIMISIPESLLAEVDVIVREGHTNRSELIREAMKMYIIEKRRCQLREQLKKGYETMGALNLTLAEESLQADEECLDRYEALLAEGN